jgi:phosphate-selective porin OprO/OprP
MCLFVKRYVVLYISIGKGEVKMKVGFKLSSAVWLALFANAALADESNDEKINRLQQMLQAQQKAMLEQQWQIQAMSDELKALQQKPTVIANEKDGIGLKSSNNDFTIKLHGLVQADYREVDANNAVASNDGWMIRKARPWIEGTLFGWIDYRLTPEFATTTSNVATNSSSTLTSVNGKTTLGTPEVIDAYFDAKFQPWFKLRVGKFKPFVGLARLQSDVDGKFLEQSFVTANLLPQRDVGAAIFGDLYDGKLSYALGYTNGVIDGGDQSVALDNNNDKEISARIFAQPFKGDGGILSGLGFGVAGTTIDQKGSATSTQLPAYRSFSQLNFFSYNSASVADGRRTRISPQMYYYKGPFGLMAEYATEDQGLTNGANHATLTHDAWQTTFSYLITGEDASYGGVKPKEPYNPKGAGWGAWEVVARFSGMNLEDDTFIGTNSATRFANINTSAKSANAWGLGVNWYLNNNTRFVMDYETTSFDGGGGTATFNAAGAITKLVDRPDEHVMIGRLQVSF